MRIRIRIRNTARTYNFSEHRYFFAGFGNRGGFRGGRGGFDGDRGGFDGGRGGFDGGRGK